jgi:hypothetical protein
MAKSSVSKKTISTSNNKLLIFAAIVMFSLLFVVLGVNHLNNSNGRNLVIYNSNAQTDKLVSAIIVKSSADGQTINSITESEVGPSTTPSPLQSNNNTGQSAALQPNSANNVGGPATTNSIQSSANINDPNIANSPLVQSVLNP